MSRFCKVLKDGLKDEAKADRYYAKLNKALREQVQMDYPSNGINLRRDLEQQEVHLVTLQMPAIVRENFMDDYNYTIGAILEELILVERHSRDGN